jgi:hypothetical protein
MSESEVGFNASETRRSLLRVWLAISAVWVTFWLLIAGVAVAAVHMRSPLMGQLDAFSLIVTIPPLALLAAGVIGLLLFNAVHPHHRRINVAGRGVANADRDC